MTGHGFFPLTQSSTLFRFTSVGVFGLLINETLLILLKEYGNVPLVLASPIAVECCILIQFRLNDRWTFKATPDHPTPRWKRFLSYQTASIIGMLINDGVLNLLVLYAAMDYRIANVLGIFVAYGWNVSFNFLYTWKKRS